MPSVGVDIPEGIIKNAIAVAIAEAFSPDKRDQIVRDIVRAHLEYKSNSYDRETMLAKNVGEMIRKVAGEEVKAVLDGPLGERVREVVRETLGEHWQDGVLAALRVSLASVVVGSLRVTINPPSEA